MGLASLIGQPAQHGGPWRDSRPGLRLPAEASTVTSRPQKRTALRDEENRPAPPSRHTNANAVIGPTPSRRWRGTLAPCRCRAAAPSRRRGSSNRSSSTPSIASAVCTCPLHLHPARRRQVLLAQLLQPRKALGGTQRPTPNAGVPW